MKIILQHFNRKIGKTHRSFNLNTNNIQDAITYAIKSELGIDSTFKIHDLQSASNYHSDLFCVVDVNYTTSLNTPYTMLVNGIEETHYHPKPARADTKIRVEVILNKVKKSLFRKIVTDISFRFKARSEFRH